MPGLVALRATSPSIVEVLLDYTRAGPFGPSPRFVRPLAYIEYGMGQASLGPCLIGTTFMISLRNCCYAAIRYEIMKVVPFFRRPLAQRPIVLVLFDSPVAFGP